MKRLFVKLIEISIIICLLFFTVLKVKKISSVSTSIGLKVFIDPGHGGKDNGADDSGVVEDEINLKIATYLYEKLISCNHIAYITRVGDYDLASLYAKNRKREDLKKRCEYINTSGADFFISIHLNKYSSSSIKGAMGYYKEDEKSLELGKCIQNKLNELTNDDKKVHTQDLFLFRNTSISGILIECGFISNDIEREKLVTSSYQKKMADYIFKGIEEYKKVR